MFTSLQTLPIIFTGISLMIFGFMMTIIVHLSMGDKWRSGIDSEGPKQLITNGFFKYSRNPIFLCVAISQIGFFLALPSLFTLVCLTIGLLMLYRQILSEEKHLTKLFVNEYKIYTASVRRWL